MEDIPRVKTEHGRRIDVSAALGEAGHEVEELGYEGIPDSGPVVDENDDEDPAERTEAALDIAATTFPTDC